MKILVHLCWKPKYCSRWVLCINQIKIIQQQTITTTAHYKYIKEINPKVQSQIMGDHIRVISKKIDDLQTIMKALKSTDDFNNALYFIWIESQFMSDLI